MFNPASLNNATLPELAHAYNVINQAMGTGRTVKSFRSQRTAVVKVATALAELAAAKGMDAVFNLPL